jgi:Ca2+-binding RTX toxin-like protein
VSVGRCGRNSAYIYADDTFVASNGSDFYSDSGGTDQIVFKDDTTLADLTFYRTAGYDLIISHVNGNQITVQNQFNVNWAGIHEYSIESIQFQNETVLDLMGIQVETRGTQNADSIGGITNWSNLNDIIYGYAGIDNLQGGDGDDAIYGGDDIDYIYGNADDDTLDGGAGNDTLYGDDGNDLLIGGAGDDTINGGTGNDTVSYAGTTSGVTVNLAAGSDQATGTETGTDQISNVENVIGGSGNDVISGDSGSNILDGGAGNDILSGGSGDDTYYYNGGTDFITETSGFDVLEINFGVDEVTDVQFRRFTSAIDDLTVYIDNGAATGSITVSGHFSSTDLQVEQVRLAPGWDLADLTDMRIYTICDTATSEIIYGVDYYLSGGAGNQDDTFFGNVTQDYIAAGSGNDSIWAGDGDDIILGGGGGDGILGEEGDDIISGEDGDDFIFGDGDGTETYSGNDIIYGGAGEDWIEGGGGIDYIYGGDDDDILFGQGSNDLLYGGDGYDSLVGGDGADTFVFENDTAFSGIDTIYDFTSGSGGDVIDLSDILTGYNSATDQLEDFLHFATSGSDTTVSVDVDGTAGGTSWTQIALIAGVTGITDEDALVASGNLVV